MIKILINGEQKDFPSSLADVTLRQYMAFHEQYGRSIDERITELQKMEDGPLKEMETFSIEDQMSCAFVAFHAGIPYDDVMSQIPADVVLVLYTQCYGTMLQEETELKEQVHFTFKDQEWELQSPVINIGSKMTFGELVDAKQIIKDLSTDSGTKWDYLHRVACIFLRKKDEPYDPLFTTTEHPRFDMMMDLPILYALQVGFFLIRSIGSFKHTLAYSRLDGEAMAATLNAILIRGDGRTFSRPSLKQRFLIKLGKTLSKVSGKRMRSRS